MKKELLWYGPAYSYSGYATHNRYMLYGLEDLGWKIKLVGTEKNLPEILYGKERLLRMKMTQLENEKDCISINLVPPPGLPCFSRYTILFTTLESKTVHEGFLRRCSMFDEVWVPCVENYLSMRRAGWSGRKLRLVPEGVDVNLYKPGLPQLPGIKSDKYTFCFVGDWSYRKGVQWLIPAFCRAFKKTDKVRLLISSHYQGGEDKQSRARIYREYEEILKRAKISNPPDVEFVYDWIPDDRLPEFYNSFDCMILLSCGEAWGLPLIQAMASGKPVITTGWGGQMDFINKKNGYPVKVKKYDTMHDKVKLAVDFYWYQKFAFPDVDNAIEILKHVFNNRGEAKEKGRKAREHIVKNFTWEKACIVADRRLNKICKALT